jgi:hypothetical protein
MHVDGDRWYLYISHFWHRGWSILDVTDPTDPQYVRFIPGPANTFTLQVQIADGLMLGSLQQMYIPGWGGVDGEPYEEGVWIWDLKNDPTDPKLLSHWHTGGTGTHRNYYTGGRYAHLSAAHPDAYGHGYRVLDVSDPTAPFEVGRWYLDEQFDDPTNPDKRHVHMHGSAYATGDRVYLPWSAAGFVILDIEDPANPRLVSHTDFPDYLGGKFAIHTIVPIRGGELAVVNSETVRKADVGPLPVAGIFDLSDETKPRMISMFPRPVPAPEEPYEDYSEKGANFGPHNQHQGQGMPYLENREDVIYLTYFNAGLRIFDITNKYAPVEVGAFVPADPVERWGPAPDELVTSSEDVLVDARGYIYLTDKNLGIQILRATV